MSETLTTYTTKVQNEADDTSAASQVIIQRAIKEAYDDILKYTAKYLVGTVEEDITATASQRYVTPTKDFMQLKEVLWKNTTSSNYTKLGRTNEDEYYERFVNSDAGDPQNFYRNGSSIYFDIAPSTAGTVKVCGIEAQDELTTQDSLIPDRFTNVVVLGSVARFKAFDSDPATNDYLALYGNALQNMVKELAVNQPIKRPKLFGK